MPPKFPLASVFRSKVSVTTWYLADTAWIVVFNGSKGLSGPGELILRWAACQLDVEWTIGVFNDFFGGLLWLK